MIYTSTGLAVGGNANNRRDWKSNRNKTWLNLAAGIGMNSCQREKWDLKNIPVCL